MMQQDRATSYWLNRSLMSQFRHQVLAALAELMNLCEGRRVI
jgi:hypothetical protein